MLKASGVFVGIQQHFSRPRSNSCNNVFDEAENAAESSDSVYPLDHRGGGGDGDSERLAVQRHLDKCRLLDSELRTACDAYLRGYAEVSLDCTRFILLTVI